MTTATYSGYSTFRTPSMLNVWSLQHTILFLVAQSVQLKPKVSKQDTKAVNVSIDKNKEPQEEEPQVSDHLGTAESSIEANVN